MSDSIRPEVGLRENQFLQEPNAELSPSICMYSIVGFNSNVD